MYDDPSPLRFSVVIPTCRRNDSLARCLQRIVGGFQVLPAGQFEVIVTDDGPPGDNAAGMIARDFPAVRWVEGPRRGPAANRNRGATQARSAWLVFTDDDCLPQATWLSGFAQRLDHGIGDCRVLEGRTTDAGIKDLGPFYIAPDNEKGGLLWSCNLAIERRFFQSLGGFDERFPFPHLEDVDLRLRLDDAGCPYLFVPDACVDHPPRPVNTALRWVRTQESAYYLARKRGVPVARFGVSLSVFVRSGFHAFRRCRSFGEGVRMAARIAAEIVLLACYLPRWSWKYAKPAA